MDIERMITRQQALDRVRQIDSMPGFLANYGEASDVEELLTRLPDQAFERWDADPMTAIVPAPTRTQTGAIELIWSEGSRELRLISHGYGGFYVKAIDPESDRIGHAADHLAVGSQDFDAKIRILFDWFLGMSPQ